MSLMMKPGSALLVIGVVSILVSQVIGVVPWFGGTLSFLLLLAGVFGIVGGVWIIISGRRHSD